VEKGKALQESMVETIWQLQQHELHMVALIQ
jgi:hypothetical protein